MKSPENSRTYADREESDRRVKVIAELMAKGNWLSRVRSRELAAQWGVSERTVRYYARAASALLWQDREDLDEMRASTLAKLEIIAAKAEKDGEWRSAVTALEALCKLLGLIQPAQVSQSFNVLVDARGKPREEWAAVLRAVLTALRPYPEAARAVLAELSTLDGAAGAGEVGEVVDVVEGE